MELNIKAKIDKNVLRHLARIRLDFSMFESSPQVGFDKSPYANRKRDRELEAAVTDRTAQRRRRSSADSEEIINSRLPISQIERSDTTSTQPRRITVPARLLSRSEANVTPSDSICAEEDLLDELSSECGRLGGSNSDNRGNCSIVIGDGVSETGAMSAGSLHSEQKCENSICAQDNFASVEQQDALQRLQRIREQHQKGIPVEIPQENRALTSFTFVTQHPENEDYAEDDDDEESEEDYNSLTYRSFNEVESDLNEPFPQEHGSQFDRWSVAHGATIFPGVFSPFERQNQSQSRVSGTQFPHHLQLHTLHHIQQQQSLNQSYRGHRHQQHLCQPHTHQHPFHRHQHQRQLSARQEVAFRPQHSNHSPHFRHMPQRIVNYHYSTGPNHGCRNFTGHFQHSHQTNEQYFSRQAQNSYRAGHHTRNSFSSGSAGEFTRSVDRAARMTPDHTPLVIRTNNFAVSNEAGFLRNASQSNNIAPRSMQTRDSSPIFVSYTTFHGDEPLNFRFSQTYHQASTRRSRDRTTQDRAHRQSLQAPPAGLNASYSHSSPLIGVTYIPHYYEAVDETHAENENVFGTRQDSFSQNEVFQNFLFTGPTDHSSEGGSEWDDAAQENELDSVSNVEQERVDIAEAQLYSLRNYDDHRILVSPQLPKLLKLALQQSPEGYTRMYSRCLESQQLSPLCSECTGSLSVPGSRWFLRQCGHVVCKSCTKVSLCQVSHCPSRNNLSTPSTADKPLREIFF